MSRTLGDLRLPRAVHPVAWWLWAIGLVVAVSRTTNPLVLALLAGSVATVVLCRAGSAPWARAFPAYLKLGLVVVVVRVVFRVLLGGDPGVGEHVLVRLPAVPLPHWMAGVSVGGPVSAEAILAATYDGLRLAVLLGTIGAANALANPKRALRSLPRALHELGVAVIVAVTVAPQLVESARRIHKARRLRGDDARGVRALRRTAMPLLHDALDRSFALAGAMEARGYGRDAGRPSPAASGLLLASLVGLVVGSYGIADASTPVVLGWPVLALAGLAAVAALRLGGRGINRSRYRPDPWRFPELLTVACGGGAGAWTIVAAHRDPLAFAPPVGQLAWPSLPVFALVAAAIAALPAVLTPVLPRRRTSPARAPRTRRVDAVPVRPTSAEAVA